MANCAFLYEEIMRLLLSLFVMFIRDKFRSLFLQNLIHVLPFLAIKLSIQKIELFALHLFCLNFIALKVAVEQMC